MPKAPTVEVEGSCGFRVTTKTWKQGHSIKCSRREGSAIRYWQPDKTRYTFTRNFSSDIEAEMWDYCRTCKLRDDRHDESQEEGQELIDIAKEMIDKKIELEEQGIDPKTYNWSAYTERLKNIEQDVNARLAGILTFKKQPAQRTQRNLESFFGRA